MVLGLKLFFLAVRQVSKPVAGVVKRAAANSENVKGVMAFCGRGMHRMNLQASRLVEGKPMLASISQLPEERAVNAGADLLSETIIYGVAGATVYYEYNLQQVDKKAKDAAAAEKEGQRREENRQNELQQWEAHARHRDELRHLEQRITLLQEELQLMRQEARERDEVQRRRGWLW
mmetsp:Transcript_20498/g.52177  ORF Transcript_20498/g.52177 Transcript_20498/m.52177 type:complete len:176 (+) Transcript_20498:100-627(+)|eukprot:CAMPEP_0115846616 /NCGR_PEP_ID=MMETSP0287-20121206/9951_1 /TAXON_ID=412157 /ORGANISM="Chrysochromulina rotalis, Strain UIO044" /LENGTH=175 /DNA_ID=CAMNT_0003300409 /DNA_START=100 /DNA_END=627 /DNA_ORIENTATION=+